MNLNYMLLQDLSYLIQKSANPAKGLKDAYQSTVELRKQMIKAFDWNEKDWSHIHSSKTSAFLP